VKLSDWNIEANAVLARKLGITTPTVCASKLPQEPGDKQARIIRLCRELGATHYLCGSGSRTYVRDGDFARFDIEVQWVDYDYEYRVPTAQGPYVLPSVLDVILSQGAQLAQDAIGRRIHRTNLEAGDDLCLESARHQ
jgi:hypothetical protein